MVKDDVDVRVFVAAGCKTPKNPQITEAAKIIGEYLGHRAGIDTVQGHNALACFLRKIDLNGAHG